MPMQYIVTVNPRNQVHVSQHPELAILLKVGVPARLRTYRVSTRVVPRGSL